MLLLGGLEVCGCSYWVVWRSVGCSDWMIWRSLGWFGYKVTDLVVGGLQCDFFMKKTFVSIAHLFSLKI